MGNFGGNQLPCHEDTLVALWRELQEKHQCAPTVREPPVGGGLILQSQSNPQMMLQPNLRIFQLDPKYHGADVSHPLGLKFLTQGNNAVMITVVLSR